MSSTIWKPWASFGADTTITEIGSDMGPQKLDVDDKKFKKHRKLPIPGSAPMKTRDRDAHDSKTREWKQRQREKNLNKFTLQPGDHGFNAQLTKIMRQQGMYIGGKLSTSCIAPSGEGFAHQESAAWIAGPSTPVNRLLVIHRTGSGKTNVMIKILDEYYFDPRPKIVIFPNGELVRNFYDKFYHSDNQYTEFAVSASEAERRANTLENFKERMAMKNNLHSAGAPGHLASPIRPIRYTIAGGSTVLGANGPQLPIYRKGMTGRNPYNNKIILMDEVHNLVSPPQGTEKRMLKKLAKLREALFNAKGSVIVGLTATPIVKSVDDGLELIRIIKGQEYASKPTNEGFISYFNALPSSIYPKSLPDTQAVNVKSIPLYGANLKKYDSKAKETKVSENKKIGINQLWRLMNYCNVATYFTQVRRKAFSQSLSRNSNSYATKLDTIVDDILQYPHKCAILIHRKLGFSALKKVVHVKDKKNEGRFQFMGKPKTLKEHRDNPVLAQFNDKKTNGLGEKIKCLVLDAEFYGEGIDLIGVRKFVLAHPAPNYAAYKQWVGRVFRSCAYTYLNENEQNVEIEMYVAKNPSGKPTADEIVLNLLWEETKQMEKSLRETFALPAADRKILGHP